MELRFALSGSVIASVVADAVPQIGSTYRIRTEQYKKGLNAGSVIEAKVSDDFPPLYDYLENVVYIDVSDYEVLEEGPPVE